MRIRARRRPVEITPDEILLDAHNLPAYDPRRLEGRINQPIGTGAFRLLWFGIALVGGAVLARAGDLMLVKGAHYRELSEENMLGHSRIIPERGVITDRQGRELAWNVPLSREGTPEEFSGRAYATTSGSAHVVGYVRLPARDVHGVLYRTDTEGVAGAEQVFDALLRGTPGTKIVETDARMAEVSTGILEPPKPGASLTLSIDANLNYGLYEAMRELADRAPFTGGAGVIMDVATGELVALTSYPEYAPQAFVAGDQELIDAYASDLRLPYLDRVVSGQFTPGSIVKPYLAVAALEEGIVQPETSFVSTGALRLANPYAPDQYSLFTDWRAHGVVNLRRALAVSSNVYFYYIGGGFGSQEGLGIGRIESYLRRFGFGAPTGSGLLGEASGVLPSPSWKAATFPDDPTWRIGDTYHTSIGQYGTQVSPLQVVRAVASLANGGILLTPRIETAHTPYSAHSINVDDVMLRIVRDGMRDGVLDGIALGLNVPYLAIAAKTGTAEIGTGKDFVHSWVTGFFPYEKPRYAFVVLMEHGPSHNLFGATAAMRTFFDWMREHAPEYVREEREK